MVVTCGICNFSLYFRVWARESYFLATRSVLWPKTCRKCDSGRGSAGGAHDAPLDPVVGWGGDTPPHTRPHSAPLVRRCSRLRRLDRRAPDTKSWQRHWSPPFLKVKLRLCETVLRKKIRRNYERQSRITKWYSETNWTISEQVMKRRRNSMSHNRRKPQNLKSVTHKYFIYSVVRIRSILQSYNYGSMAE